MFKTLQYQKSSTSRRRSLVTHMGETGMNTGWCNEREREGENRDRKRERDRRDRYPERE